MQEVLTIGRVGTLFAALHGALELHPWRDSSAESDAYSLFVARSSAMGWLADPAEHTRDGVWGMNDAGHAPGAGSAQSRIVWFQVSISDAILGGRLLPLQAFISCAGDVVRRIGVMRLDALQLLLPVQHAQVSAVPSLLQAAGWFADPDPDSRTPVRVTVDGGQEPAIRSVAPVMLNWMRDVRQDVFLCDSLSLTDHDPLASQPVVIDQLWRGSALHRVTFRGALAEWSLDALGWLAAFLADAAHRHGVDAPLLLTAVRA